MLTDAIRCYQMLSEVSEVMPEFKSDSPFSALCVQAHPVETNVFLVIKGDIASYYVCSTIESNKHDSHDEFLVLVIVLVLRGKFYHKKQYFDLEVESVIVLWEKRGVCI